MLYKLFPESFLYERENSNIAEHSNLCSKSSTDGVPGDGTGESQGNCGSGEICYPDGRCSSKCSKSAIKGNAGDGTGNTQGNCQKDEYCYSNGECSRKCSKSPNGKAGDGSGKTQKIKFYANGTTKLACRVQANAMEDDINKIKKRLLKKLNFENYKSQKF